MMPLIVDSFAGGGMNGRAISMADSARPAASSRRAALEGALGLRCDDVIHFGRENACAFRKGDERTTGGLGFDLVVHCGPAGVHGQGMRRTTLPRRPFIQKDVRLNDGRDVARKSEAHKNPDRLFEDVVLHTFLLLDFDGDAASTAVRQIWLKKRAFQRIRGAEVIA